MVSVKREKNKENVAFIHNEIFHLGSYVICLYLCTAYNGYAYLCAHQPCVEFLLYTLCVCVHMYTHAVCVFLGQPIPSGVVSQDSQELSVHPPPSFLVLFLRQDLF